jgi:BMFP domain-containing protein YqiC
MQSQNRLFDDFVKMMNGAAGTVAGMTREAEGAMRDRFRDWIGGLDMVSRDEFEAVKAIAVAAREETQALRARIEALEAGSAGAAASSAPRSRKAPGGGTARTAGDGGAGS